ncbi:hypothetical protein QFC21_000018 [Naganishia friedmannii]|uniref:Uncharacterized protein n=1 Tax=Naganishia friedmannii TaxID=89922 RepID=A0ACC2WAB8_9TREE|nr:hypothetical protein QFC21_000018 [Naganishia friedmannii]
MDKNGPDQSSEHATDQPNIGNDTLLTPSVPTHPLSQLPRLRRNLLYTVLCIALSLDALSTSSMFTSTEIIAADIGLAEGGNAIWIVSASAMASAAFIPLGGRLADVLPPRWWFVGGFVGMTGLTLGNSFVKDKKLFLALRSLQGVCAALTLPSGLQVALISKIYASVIHAHRISLPQQLHDRSHVPRPRETTH